MEERMVIEVEMHVARVKMQTISTDAYFDFMDNMIMHQLLDILEDSLVIWTETSVLQDDSSFYKKKSVCLWIAEIKAARLKVFLI